MAVKTFTADGNKTVTVVGTKYNVTPTDIPAEVTITLDDTPLVNGTPVTITKDSVLKATVTPPKYTITIDYTDTNEPVITNTAG